VRHCIALHLNDLLGFFCKKNYEKQILQPPRRAPLHHLVMLEMQCSTTLPSTYLPTGTTPMAADSIKPKTGLVLSIPELFGGITKDAIC
jgi:hypothetical protein